MLGNFSYARKVCFRRAPGVVKLKMSVFSISLHLVRDIIQCLFNKQCTVCTLQTCNYNSVFGSHAFYHTAPRIWNSLPQDLTDVFNTVSEPVFKRRLKTKSIKAWLPTSFISQILNYLTTWSPRLQFAFRLTYGALPAVFIYFFRIPVFNPRDLEIGKSKLT